MKAYISRLALFVSLLALLLLPAQRIEAQTDVAQLSGLVTDASGAVLPKASVLIVNQDTGISRAVLSNDEGQYMAPALQPGRYRVTVEASGFKTLVTQQVVLNVGQKANVSFKLEVGSKGETVSVDGNTADLNTTDATVSTVIDRQFVENIPLNGRTLQSLITDAPGVVTTSTPVAGEQGQFSSVGQRAGSNYFSIDGVSANFGIEVAQYLAEGGNGGLPALSALGTTASLVSLDELQEFRLESSTYTPEFGRGSGAQIVLVTRSGTNHFHGSVFDYFRNDALDATDWFASNTGQPKPRERQNDFGGTLGGPIFKDKTFFFFSYEGLRVTQPIFQVSDVPSLEARANAPSIIKTFFNSFPLPNGPSTGEDLQQLATSAPNKGVLDETSLRIDQTLGAKWVLFARANYSPSTLTEAFSGFPSNNPFDTRVHVATLTVGANAVLTPDMANEARVNFSRATGSQRQLITDFGGAIAPPLSDLSSPWQDPYTSNTPIFLLDGRNEAPLAFGLYGNNVNHQWNVTDTLSMTKGKHAMKFGFDFRRLTPIQRLPSTFNEYLWFYTSSAAQGNIPDITAVLQDHSNIQQLYRNFSAYAQDTWKVSPRLTLNYGVRWDYNPPPSETNGAENAPYALSQTNDLSTAVLLARGTPLWHAEWTGFAPRIGLAYQLGHDRVNPTILRAGFGQFYDLGTDTAAFLNNGEGWFPWGIGTTLCFEGVGPDCGSIIPYMGPKPAFDYSQASADPMRAFDTHLKMPYSLEWSFALEKQLSSSQTFKMTYVGSVGRSLLRDDVTANPNPATENLFTSLYLTRNSGYSNYNGLHAQFQRRLSHGLQTLFSYAWSHSLDVNSSNVTYEDPALPTTLYSVHEDYGNSDNDIRHVFSAALTYDVPAAPFDNWLVKAVTRQWSLSSNSTFRTGSPFTVEYTPAVSGAYETTQGSFSFRPDVVPGQPIWIPNATAPGGRALNIAAFSIPTVLTQGTERRNGIYGFPLVEMDLAARREFSITERVRMRFRAEGYNLINHPNFANPSSNLGTCSFGGPCTTAFGWGTAQQMLNEGLGSSNFHGTPLNGLYQVGGPRSLQLALQVQF
jgi:hypothetical protein